MLVTSYLNTILTGVAHLKSTHRNSVLTSETYYCTTKGLYYSSKRVLSGILWTGFALNFKGLKPFWTFKRGSKEASVLEPSNCLLFGYTFPPHLCTSRRILSVLYISGLLFYSINLLIIIEFHFLFNAFFAFIVFMAEFTTLYFTAGYGLTAYLCTWWVKPLNPWPCY